MPKVESTSQGGSSRGGRRARGARVSSSLAEINVVPLVDVMLVLLVIFMVAAPMMTQGFPVKLPQSRRSSAVEAPVTVTVPMSFRQDQRVQIDGEFIGLAALAERARQAVRDRPEKSIMLALDGDITSNEMIRVWDRLREGGVEQVNVQTQPTTGRR